MSKTLKRAGFLLVLLAVVHPAQPAKVTMGQGLAIGAGSAAVIGAIIKAGLSYRQYKKERAIHAKNRTLESAQALEEATSAYQALRSDMWKALGVASAGAFVAGYGIHGAYKNRNTSDQTPAAGNNPNASTISVPVALRTSSSGPLDEGGDVDDIEDAQPSAPAVSVIVSGFPTPSPVSSASPNATLRADRLSPAVQIQQGRQTPAQAASGTSSVVVTPEPSEAPAVSDETDPSVALVMAEEDAAAPFAPTLPNGILQSYLHLKEGRSRDMLATNVGDLMIIRRLHQDAEAQEELSSERGVAPAAVKALLGVQTVSQLRELKNPGNGASVAGERPDVMGALIALRGHYLKEYGADDMYDDAALAYGNICLAASVLMAGTPTTAEQLKGLVWRCGDSPIQNVLEALIVRKAFASSANSQMDYFMHELLPVNTFYTAIGGLIEGAPPLSVADFKVFLANPSVGKFIRRNALIEVKSGDGTVYRYGKRQLANRKEVNPLRMNETFEGRGVRDGRWSRKLINLLEDYAALLDKPGVYGPGISEDGVKALEKQRHALRYYQVFFDAPAVKEVLVLLPDSTKDMILANYPNSPLKELFGARHRNRKLAPVPTAFAAVSSSRAEDAELEKEYLQQNPEFAPVLAALEVSPTAEAVWQLCEMALPPVVKEPAPALAVRSFMLEKVLKNKGWVTLLREEQLQEVSRRMMGQGAVDAGLLRKFLSNPQATQAVGAQLLRKQLLGALERGEVPQIAVFFDLAEPGSVLDTAITPEVALDVIGRIGSRDANDQERSALLDLIGTPAFGRKIDTKWCITSCIGQAIEYMELDGAVSALMKEKEGADDEFWRARRFVVECRQAYQQLRSDEASAQHQAAFSNFHQMQERCNAVEATLKAAQKARSKALGFKRYPRILQVLWKNPDFVGRLSQQQKAQLADVMKRVNQFLNPASSRPSLNQRIYEHGGGFGDSGKAIFQARREERDRKREIFGALLSRANGRRLSKQEWNARWHAETEPVAALSKSDAVNEE